MLTQLKWYFTDELVWNNNNSEVLFKTGNFGLAFIFFYAFVKNT